MQIKPCEGCGENFTAPFAPCPDGRENCAMAHYNAESWICPHCGHDMYPAVAKTMREGPHTMEIGIGFGNIKSIQKLELK